MCPLVLHAGIVWLKTGLKPAKHRLRPNCPQGPLLLPPQLLPSFAAGSSFPCGLKEHVAQAGSQVPHVVILTSPSNRQATQSSVGSL